MTPAGAARPSGPGDASGAEGTRPVAADLLGAHSRLAAIDPGAPEPLVLEQVLEALLMGAGVGQGLALDPTRPEIIVARGLELPDSLRTLLAASAGKPSTETLREVLSGDPRPIPITADDDVLAVVVLGGPPSDPVGFASVTAHAASLLCRIRMAEKVREADFELKYRVWELESLYEVGLSIAGTLDLDSLADDILLKSISLLNARKGTLLLREDVGEGPMLKEFGGSLLSDADESHLPRRIFRLPKGAVRPESLAGADAEALLGVPIQSDGQHLGFLIVADKESRGGAVEDFNERDERILSLFGNQAAIALENARLHRESVEKERMEREIELAASIQKTILPEALPVVQGLVLAGGNRPTRQVGGDYFDVLPLPDGRIALCVADVAGKGVPAALLVSTVHACLHLLIERAASELPAFLAVINRHLLRFSAARKFVTLFVAVYEPDERRLVYVNAGHNPGIWLSGDAVTLLPSGGVPIGMIPNVTHRAAEVKLSPGDLVALYSDGITEAIDAADEEFGMERLTRLLVDHRLAEPSELSGRIFSAVAEFTRGVAQYDDQTVLIARAE